MSQASGSTTAILYGAIMDDKSCDETSFDAYLGQLRDRGVKLMMLEESETLRKAALSGQDHPISVTLSESANRLQKQLGSCASELMTRTSAMKSMLSRMFSGKARPIKTFSEPLNKILGGGICVGRLGILGAPPKKGKTTLMVRLGHGFAEQEIPTLIISCEMSEFDLLRNTLSRLSRINSSIIQEANWNVDTHEIRDLTRKCEKAGAKYDEAIAPHFQIVEGGVDMNCAKIRALISQFRIELGQGSDRPFVLLVDSIHRMSTGVKGLDNGGHVSEKVGHITHELKAIARELNVAVIAISEITKEAFKSAEATGTVDFSCFKDSSAIIHLADYAMTLQSGGLEHDDPEKCKDQLTLHFAGKGKHRGPFPGVTEESIREEFPLNESLSSTFARLTIGLNRYGATGEVMFLYDKAVHDFVSIATK